MQLTSIDKVRANIWHIVEIKTEYSVRFNRFFGGLTYHLYLARAAPVQCSTHVDKNLKNKKLLLRCDYVSL